MDNRFYLHALGVTGLFVALLLVFWIASGAPPSEADVQNASSTRTAIAMTEAHLLRPSPTNTPLPFMVPTFAPQIGVPGSTLPPASETSLPAQIDTPISSPVPSATPLPARTTVVHPTTGTAASHAQPTRAPAVRSRPEDGRQDPAEFARWYFARVWQVRDYQYLWDNYLTPSYKANVGSGIFEDYVSWWNSVERVDVNAVDVLENNGTNGLVRVNLTFHMQDGRILRNEVYEYDFFYDTNRGTWMFDFGT